MNKIPGFFVVKPKDVLLAEIDATLETAFAACQQKVLDSVRELVIAATSEQAHMHLGLQQGHDPREPRTPHAVVASEHLLQPSADRCPMVQAATCIQSSDRAQVAKEGVGRHVDEKRERAKVWAQREQAAIRIQSAERARVAHREVGRLRGDKDIHLRMLASRGQENPDSDSGSDDLSPVQPTQTGSTHRTHRKNQEATESIAESVTDSIAESMISKFSRRPSHTNTQYFADLREELDWQPGSERPEQILHRWCLPYIKLARALNPCKYIGAERIEPRDLHFGELAAQRGKQWKLMPLHEQVDMIREELTSSSLLIDPQSDEMKFWDILVMLCLVYTALVLPYDIAFLETEYGPMYVINHMIDVVFLIDMVMQFFLKLRVEVRHKTRWIRNRKQIAKAYLKSWFAVDLLSIIPYDDISNSASSGDGSDLEHLRVMRLLRVLRLLKLFRMLKASRLVKRWENRNSLQSSRKHMIKCCILILVSVHWMACIWGFVGFWEGSTLKCRKATQGDVDFAGESSMASWYIDPEEEKAPNDPSAWHGQSWVVHFALHRASSRPIDPCDRLTLYIVSIYWAIMTMTSIGYGDIIPQILTEYVVACLCMVVSGFVWAYIIGCGCSVLSNLYPETTEFEQRLDAFNAMASDMQIPTKIRLRGREFLRESRYKWSHERNLAVIQGLGFDLQANLSKQSAQLYLGNINLFSRCSELFCADCAAVMVPHFFEPHYVIQLPNDLCVVEKGAVGHAGRVLVPWNHWGEDFIVVKIQLRFKADAVALNYALVVSLGQDRVQKVLGRHPLERVLFKRAAVCMALVGAVRIYLDDLETGNSIPEHRWIHGLIDRPSSCISAAPAFKPPDEVPVFQSTDGAHYDVPFDSISLPPSYTELMSLPKSFQSHNGHALEQALSTHSSIEASDMNSHRSQNQGMYTLLTKEPSRPTPVQPHFTASLSS